jgi:hypothetical protein
VIAGGAGALAGRALFGELAARATCQIIYEITCASLCRCQLPLARARTTAWRASRIIEEVRVKQAAHGSTSPPSGAHSVIASAEIASRI